MKMMTARNIGLILKLDKYDMKELRRLKNFIYETRVKHRKEKDRQEKKEAKQQDILVNAARFGTQILFNFAKK